MASDGGVLGYIFNDANGPCVPFVTLGPSLIRCFTGRTGLNLASNPNPFDKDLQVSFTGTSILAEVRCLIWRSHPSIAMLSHFASV